jgi:hypothetical protein
MTQLDQSDALRRLLLEESDRTGLGPIELAKRLTEKPTQPTVSFRPTAVLRASLDHEAKRRSISVGQTCKVLLEEWATNQQEKDQ